MTLEFGADLLCRHGSIESRCDKCDPYRAKARRSDPETSWQAAESVDLTKGQRLVLEALRQFGPMTDEELVTRVRLSPSGARSRRAELVRKNLVKATGRSIPLATGNYGTEWKAV